MSKPQPGGAWTRRDVAAALLGCGAYSALAGKPKVTPLGFQVHALRRYLQEDFDGTLHTMRQAGYTRIEMCSFPGFRGDHRGDFGALADVPAEELRRRILRQGLSCNACNFTPGEILEPQLEKPLAWARALGVEWIIVAGITPPRDAGELDQLATQIREASTRLGHAGLRLGLHTDQTLWRPFDGRPLIEHLIARLSAHECALEFDFGGIVAYELDAETILKAHPGRFRWMHVRDGAHQADPTLYVPAIVPGEGTQRWPSIFAAARHAGVKEFIVEMETHSGHELDDYVRAYPTTMEFLS